jgi:phenylalanyl-tRNA synthetase alpha chain
VDSKNNAANPQGGLDESTLKQAAESALSAIAGARDLNLLAQIKIEHIGDKSALARANQSLGKQSPADKAKFGKIIGALRAQVTSAYEAKASELETVAYQAALDAQSVDVTIGLNKFKRGALHPLTLLTNEISDLFIGLGYEVAEGPEIEAEWLNFDALNIPADHPARTMQDTFFIQPNETVESANESSHLVLRTHTSPVQIRTMLKKAPPIYVICPGRTFRADELDATHTPVFSQVEGLVIDKGITMADLKGVLDHFARSIFGQDVTIRLRPSFFPFTEPSAELDFYYNGRWVEWGGCGMVNPKVLQAAGIDPNEYSGFAFGMGLERTLMLRHGIKDMHDIVEGDVRFSQIFGMGL